MPLTPNTGLQALVQEADSSPARLARMLSSLAAESGLSLTCDPSTVRRWLDGARPRPPAPTLLLECLSQLLGRPVTAREAGLTHAPAPFLNPSWEAEPIHKLHQLALSEADPDPQAESDTQSFSLTLLALPDQLILHRPPRQRTDASVGSPRPGHAEVEHIRGMTVLFHNAAEQYGGQHVRAALATYLARQASPLLHSPAPDRVHRDLLSATAQLTLLLGRMCADSGRDRSAQYNYQVAAQLAAAADDSTTCAIALRTMAAHAHDLGHRTPAVLNLGEQAAIHARHAPPAVQAYTQAGLAVLRAHHDRHAALAALARAERVADHSDSAPGPFTAYSAGALGYQHAQTFTALGEPSNALAALSASLHVRTSGEHRAVALTRARLAEIHLDLGRLEQALPDWQAFLAIYPTLQSARAARCLQIMRRRLQPHRHHHAAGQLLSQASLLN